MNNPGKKRTLCILTALALLVALGAAYWAYGIARNVSAAESGMLKKLNCVTSSYERLCQRRTQIVSHYDNMLTGNVMLNTLPLRELLKEKGALEIRTYDSGFVARLDGDDVAMPRDVTLPAPDGNCFRDASGKPLDSGSFYCSDGDSEDSQYSCRFCNIAGDYYYVDYTHSGEREEYVDSYINTSAILDQLGNTFQGYILIYSPDGGDDPILYKSGFFDDCRTLAETGVNADLPARTFDSLTLNGVKCLYTLSKPVMLPDADHSFQVVFAVPWSGITAQPPSRLISILGIAALAFVVAISWMLSVCQLIRRSVINEAQRKRYRVSRVRKVIACIGIVGMLVTMVMSMFINALLLLYDATLDNQYMLGMLSAVESQAKEDEALVKAHQENIYVNYAQRVAALLDANPQLRNRQTMQEICDTVNVDYLILFDDHGNETLSNAPFVNLTLGDSVQYGGSDFRRLLKGMPSVVHAPGPDEATGLTRQLIGVCMQDDDVSNGYGALILACFPEDPADTDVMTIDEQMREMTAGDSLCLIIDPETGEILHSANAEHIGDDARILGLSERALQDHFMDFLRFDNQRWYGCSSLADGRLYLCATLTSAAFSRLPLDALVYGGLFAAAYALLAAALLAGYTDANIEACGGTAIQEREAIQRLQNVSGDLEYRRVVRALREMDAMRRHKPPEHQALFAFSTALGVLLLLMVAGVFVRKDSGSAFYLLSYVMGDGWQPGINLFAVARVFLTIVYTYLLLMGLDLICALLCRVLERRGETICRLIDSLVKYAAVLVVLFSSFNWLGFDTGTLLASVGILSLALSLGAKDLVADVLSGVSIAFADQYQIGDFIDIGGFRGWVLEIGVRSTTLVNNDGHIKTMCNRDVKNVLNLSRRNCRYSINITINYDQPLQAVEEIMERELPKIGEGVDEILNGPTYQGVTSLGNGGMTLTIVAECKEQNYGKVRARLNREIRLMLEKNGIVIK